MLRPAPFRAAAARHSVLASPSSCPDSSRFSRPCPEPLACGLSSSFVHSRCSHSRLNRTARPEACCSTLNRTCMKNQHFFFFAKPNTPFQNRTNTLCGASDRLNQCGRTKACIGARLQSNRTKACIRARLQSCRWCRRQNHGALAPASPKWQPNCHRLTKLYAPDSSLSFPLGPGPRR